MTVEEDQALSHAEFWDARYLVRDGESREKPTHEWFRSYDDLQGYFQRHLLEAEGFEPEDNPLILHLGSGDSVCTSYSFALSTMHGLRAASHIYLGTDR